MASKNEHLAFKNTCDETVSTPSLAGSAAAPPVKGQQVWLKQPTRINAKMLPRWLAIATGKSKLADGVLHAEVEVPALEGLFWRPCSSLCHGASALLTTLGRACENEALQASLSHGIRSGAHLDLLSALRGAHGHCVLAKEISSGHEALQSVPAGADVAFYMHDWDKTAGSVPCRGRVLQRVGLFCLFQGLC